MTTVAEIAVSADPALWRRAGFRLDDAVMRIGSVRIRFVPPGDRVGIVSWTLVGAPHTADSIDGLATHHVDEPPSVDALPVAPSSTGSGTLDVLGFDHIVVMTDDLERTCGAIVAATGSPLKRIREVGSMRQGFHRLGEVIIEVVTRPDIPAGPATFWGFVVNVANLDEVAAHLGPDVISPPKDAVQPGRRIATFRQEAGLGLPLALMTV